MCIASMPSIAPKKRFGQNFLINKGVVQKILTAAAIQPGEPLLEIGPGPGTLTDHLAQLGNPLTAIDADGDMVTLLAEKFASAAHVSIVQRDITTHTPAVADAPTLVIGNIPYNISSPIIFWLIDHRTAISRAVLMVQREVALRVCAAPGSKQYGALSIGVQAYARADKLFDVSPGSFWPAPKVTSSVIRLTFPAPPPYAIADAAQFRDTVRRAFQQRRKMMRGLFTADALAAAGIAPTARPETCTIEQFAALAAHAKT